ncbi:sensor domain-containing diguanylate cyclase [Sulfurirhabdus autotrophica]|uniref:diguanylate cyclase n=1 Tax=Sulfurirhabdus autotrophica TaxID=1706046 RepID=A0A4V6P404_9PROT|nr:diguanylate cyclase [Sulfurirhabdus autotrophica]TCV90079.1 diguanylate cyclase (GGDEF)-like protein [Sulfurirhabdus autotrophica]
MSKSPSISHQVTNYPILALIFLAFAGIMLSKTAWQGSTEPRQQLGKTQVEVASLAESIAERQTTLLTESRHLLKVLGGVTVSDLHGTWNCDALLSRQLESFPEYDNLAFASSDGLIRCSALPWQQSTEQIAQQLALNAPNSLSISSMYLTDNSLLLSASNIAPSGQKVGSVLAQISANRFLHPAGVRLPSNIQIAILNHNGNLVAAYPSQTNWNSITHKDNSFIEALINLKNENATALKAPDGVTRLYTAKAVHGASHELTLIVGQTVENEANTLTTNNNLAFGGVILTSLGMSGLLAVFISMLLLRLKNNRLLLLKTYLSLNNFLTYTRQYFSLFFAKVAMPQNNESNSGLIRQSDYDSLKQSLAIQEEHSRHIERLDQLSQSLQSCVSNADVASAVALCTKYFFPVSSGALLLKTGSNKAGVLLKWGNNIEDALLIKDYQNILQNRLYPAVEVHTATNAAQLPIRLTKSLWIPLITHNEILGALHITELDVLEHKNRQEYFHWLANSIAERAAIALRSAKQQQKLRFKATRDVLTGLYNRRFMEETLIIEERRALRRGSHIGIMMLDVDHFKHYNDTYGHDAGDTLLRTVGELLRKTVRKCDIPCRYGGEEFVIILPGADLKDTSQRAEMLRMAIEKLSIQHNGQALAGVTVSIGAASFPQNGDAWQSVLKTADQALYQAKHAGRNRIAEPACLP